MSNPTQAITPQKQRRDISTLLQGEEFRGAVANALPKHLKPERFIRIAINALTRTPKLLECTQESFFRCLLDLSSLGLEPDGRRAHLIPYGKECTLIVDYKGLAEMAMRSGIISVIHADVVCENDEFEYDRGELTTHKIDYRKSRGEMFAAYALVKFKDGTEKCDVMSKEDIVAIQRRSRAGNNGPWKTDFNEMAKKTVFRRLSKWLPLSAEFRDALEVDEDELASMKRLDSAPQFVPAMDLGAGDTKPQIGDGSNAGEQELPMTGPRETIAALMKRDGIDEDSLLRFIRQSDEGDFKNFADVPDKTLATLVIGWEKLKG